MIRSLVFAPRGVRSGGKLVCDAAFERRTSIDPARICTVAASVRERLAEHLGFAPRVEVFDPLIPEQAAWPVLFSDASVFEVCADLPVCLIVRHVAARRLVAAAFGETCALTSGALSPIEKRILERLVKEISLALESLCGASRGAPRQLLEPRAHRCYFEMRFGAPIDATIGVALEEPACLKTGTLPADMLSDIEIDCAVQLPMGTRSAGEVASLRVGSVVRFSTKVGDPAALKVDGQTVAMGECGSRGESAAFLIRTLSLIGVFP